MKKRNPQLNNGKLLFVTMLIAVALGVVNSFFSRTGVAEVKAEEKLVEVVSQSPIATTETLSNGTEVINTKTKYFENEVQVWLASNEACKSAGLGEACVKDLMAMAWTETRSFNYKAMGDGNKSYGAWQIHLGYHPDITIVQATDPYWAAKWTLTRMIKLGYKTDRAYAIRSHNGNPKEPQTLQYLETVNKYLAM